MTEPKVALNTDIQILIAEDSPTQAEQLKHCLAKRSYTITEARNGREALAAVAKNKPALVITDVVMPIMDGFALCKGIKSQPKIKDVPVILLTSLSKPHDVLKGIECGADHFIRKPYDERYLLSRIDRILATTELRKAEPTRPGVELSFGGQNYLITAERQQILDLLISTYEGAIQMNEELERKQSELETLNKDLEAFSYSVSHDLRSPLRQIDGYTALLLESHNAQLQPEAQEFLKTISNTVRNMAQLVEDLLKMAHLGRQQITSRMTDLNALVESVLRDLRAEADGRPINWQIGRLPEIECDPGLMRSVFANLLSNAIKYTRRRELAVIQIDQKTVDGETIVLVRDNGAGFDPKYAGKLFGVFQRLHSATEFEGTGLGLATVQRIIQKHGGRVWAEGKVNGGATFFFTLGLPTATAVKKT